MQHNNKISILSTGSLSRELVKTTEHRGFQIDVVPFIKVELLQTTEVIKSIKETSLQPGTVVFTSINAAEKVIRELNGAKPQWAIFCIGHATHNTLIGYFGKEAIAGIADNASDLAQAILRNRDIKKVIFFCGDQRREELPGILSANQVKVEEIIVYKTMHVLNKLSKDYHGILFFSPSAVTAFFQNNSIRKETILFAIGNTTAETIKQFSNNNILISHTPGKEDLLNTMSSYFEEKQNEIFN